MTFSEVALVDKIHRLRRMPVSELAGRSRQEAAKLLDRVKARDRLDKPAAILRAHAPALAHPAAAMQILREKAPRRFFAGAEEMPVRIGEQWAVYRAELLASAAETMAGRFNLLGYRGLCFGDPIDWSFDPIGARRAPRVHWTRVNPLDPEVVGDSKVIWELNRHQWVARLGAAYAIARDDRYAECALASLDSWMLANPYGTGINWCSSLEVAYRVMSWTWTLMLLRDAPALTSDRLARILAHLWLHAGHIARYLSFYFSPNTHLTGEALGLFYAGTVFPEFDQARAWRNLGAHVLTAESRSQICPDGVHFERSTCYHTYTIDTYLQYLLLATRNRLPVASDLEPRLCRALEFALSIRQPDGLLPDIGDCDSGRLLPLVERPTCDARGSLAVGAAVFARPDFASAGGTNAPEVFWLLGNAGLDAPAPTPPSVSAMPASRLFSAGGYCVMRSGWDREAHQLILDGGPLGCPVSAGHGHADLLSVQCWAFGERILADAGTYCYTPDRRWRDFFRGTSAHSTVTIDGRDQVETGGTFSWRGRAQAEICEWQTNEHSDFIDAVHRAYPGLTHRRRVLFVKPHYWVIVDDVEAERAGAVHRIELGFQFAPMRVETVRDRWARADTPAGNTVWIGSFGSCAARPVVRSGETAPIRGWISTSYGQRTPAPQLVFAATTRLPWRSITLVLPDRGAGTPLPSVTPLVDQRAFPIGLRLEHRNESILVGDTDVFRATD